MRSQPGEVTAALDLRQPAGFGRETAFGEEPRTQPVTIGEGVAVGGSGKSLRASRCNLALNPLALSLIEEPSKQQTERDKP
jgi:hypothetical protein